MPADDLALALLDTPLDELQERARARRDATSGRRITYSPKVFIPLTQLCRDRCGYCTFAQPPARLEAPYLSPDEGLGGARHPGPPPGSGPSPATAPTPGATRRCSPWANGRSCGTPRLPRGCPSTA